METIDRNDFDKIQPKMQSNMKIIEFALSDLKFHTAIELRNLIKNKEGNPISLRALQDILKELDEKAYGNGKYNKIIRKRGEKDNPMYCLENNTELAFPEIIFTSQDRTLITSLLKIVAVFDGALPINKLLSNIKIKDSDVKDFFRGKIDIEYNHYIHLWVSLLYDAIVQEKVIEFEYREMKRIETSTFLVSPYLLKNFNNRWHLIGHIHKPFSFDWSVFSLDRIINIKPYNGSKSFRKIDLEIINKYYDSVIGFYVPNQAGESIEKNLTPDKLKPIDVKIKLLDKDTFYYIQTNPIHKSQQCDKKKQEISFRVVENPLLYSRLFSFGSKIEVLEPPFLRERIIEDAFKVIGSYKTK